MQVQKYTDWFLNFSNNKKISRISPIFHEYKFITDFLNQRLISSTLSLHF